MSQETLWSTQEALGVTEVSVRHKRFHSNVAGNEFLVKTVPCSNYFFCADNGRSNVSNCQLFLEYLCVG